MFQHLKNQLFEALFEIFNSNDTNLMYVLVANDNVFIAENIYLVSYSYTKVWINYAKHIKVFINSYLFKL